MRPIVVEASGTRTGKVFYRWTCAHCGAYGSWIDLNEAERGGAEHNRKAHDAGRALA